MEASFLTVEDTVLSREKRLWRIVSQVVLGMNILLVASSFAFLDGESLLVAFLVVIPVGVGIGTMFFVDLVSSTRYVNANKLAGLSEGLYILHVVFVCVRACFYGGGGILLWLVLFDVTYWLVSLLSIASVVSAALLDTILVHSVARKRNLIVAALVCLCGTFFGFWLFSSPVHFYSFLTVFRGQAARDVASRVSADRFGVLPALSIHLFPGTRHFSFNSKLEVGGSIVVKDSAGTVVGRFVSDKDYVNDTIGLHGTLVLDRDPITGESLAFFYFKRGGEAYRNANGAAYTQTVLVEQAPPPTVPPLDPVDIAIGPKDSKVQLVYSPHLNSHADKRLIDREKEEFRHLKRVTEAYADRVLVIFRFSNTYDVHLSVEERRYVTAAYCSSKQRHYLDYTEALLVQREQKGLPSEEKLRAIAIAVGLDEGVFTACLNDPHLQSQLEELSQKIKSLHGYFLVLNNIPTSMDTLDSDIQERLSSDQ